MMRSILFAGALAIAVAAGSAADARSRCEAYAHNRRVTGTVVGALGGGLLGSAVAGHGSKGTGALIGAGLGAVVGNNLSRVSCDRYAVRHARRHSARVTTPAYAGDPRYAVNTSASCHYETRPYYDRTGRLLYTPEQVCQ
jgi:uncharacterized protein YcfJ